MSRADELNARRRIIEAPAARPATQAPRPEVPRFVVFPAQVVIRSHDEATLGMTAQLVKGTDQRSAGEVVATLVEHPVAFGPVFDVKPLLGTPHSFWKIDGLVVPLPATPELRAAEELGENFVVCLLLPGTYVTLSLKAPGAPFSDAAAEASEAGSV